jgi:hypothetical protein
MGYNLNIQSELDLLLVQKAYLNDNLALSDILSVLIKIERNIIDDPYNGFLSRLRSFIRHQSQLPA